MIPIKNLKNSLRLICETDLTSENVHLGYFVHVGSRHEKAESYGLAHMLEHMLFKGTRKHTAHYILNRIDILGGELNAYTTKEKTVLHISVHKSHLKKAIALLVELTSSSIFPPEELDKEKNVIADEIDACADNPYELITDEFEELFFKDHALSHPILGTKSSVKSLTRTQLTDFYNRHYSNANALLSVYGNCSSAQVEKLVLDFFPASSGAAPKAKGNPPKSCTFNHTLSKDTKQAHCVIGFPAYPMAHKNRLQAVVLNNVLGGPAMNSLLNMNIRERYGYCYHIESQYVAYTDAGLLSFYFGAEKSTTENVLTLIDKELKKIKSKKFSTQKVHAIKTQLIGQLSLARDNRMATMLANGRAALFLDKVYTFEEIYAKIDALTSTQLWHCANELFIEKNKAVLIYN